MRKSVVAVKDIPKGTIITNDMIGIKRPGYGIKPSLFQKIIGSTALVYIKSDSIIELDELEIKSNSVVNSRTSFNEKVLFITREDSFNNNIIIPFIKKNFEATIICENRTKSIPKTVYDWSGDYIFSYLCPWIIPMSIIKKAEIAAINFHPGSPKYPGSGCYNFAIYNGEKEYGVTCHFLSKK